MPESQDTLDDLRDVLAGAPLERVVPVGDREIQAVTLAGYQLYEQGQWAKARNAFSALTALAPTVFAGYAGLGALALRESKFDDALKALGKAVELRTNDPAVFANLGELLLRMEKPKDAAVFLKCAIELDPAKRNAAANRARAMLEGIEEGSSSG